MKIEETEKPVMTEQAETAAQQDNTASEHELPTQIDGDALASIAGGGITVTSW